MERKRYDGWKRDTEVYTQEQVEAVINECGIEVAYESASHFIGYCPFHNNSDSPAFEVDKTKGLYTCFNPGCGASGNLTMLLQKLKGYNRFKATRCIVLAGGNSRPVSDRLAEIRSKPAVFVPFPEGPVQRMSNDFIHSDRATDYMLSRGFATETMLHFDVGYSDKRDSVIVPMHDPDGMLVGFIARSVEGKEFRNTDDLPKAKTAWNFHRAKKTGDTVIIVESTFDAMRIHQAGYSNVIALLGGSISPYHIEQIDKTFSKVIIMTDCEYEKRYEKDRATGRILPCAKCKRSGFHLCQGHRDGRELGRRIAKAFPSKKVMWAAYDDNCVYPNQAKDATDLSDADIRQCLTNAVGNFIYERWGIEKTMDDSHVS